MQVSLQSVHLFPTHSFVFAFGMAACQSSDLVVLWALAFRSPGTINWKSTGTQNWKLQRVCYITLLIVVLVPLGVADDPMNRCPRSC